MTMSMKKNSSDPLISGVLAAMWLIPSIFSPVYSDEVKGSMERESTEDQWLSDNASAQVKTEKYTIQEQRVGGRLERITIYHHNRLTETYENSAVDSMWLSAEKELGEMPNVRRWIIGSW